MPQTQFVENPPAHNGLDARADTFLPHWGRFQRSLHTLCKRSRFFNHLISSIEMRVDREEVISLPQYIGLCPTGQRGRPTPLIARMPAGRGKSLIRPALVGLALACIATGFWRFCGFMRHGGITNDWPWLYRTGLEIWQYGLPARDTLSWTYPERAWTLYQWLFEAVAAPIYAGLGATASVFVLCLFGFVLYAAAPAWVLARRGVQPWLTLAVGSVVLVPVGLNFSLRPMLATLALLAVQWVWLARWRAGRLRFAVAAVGLAIGYALWSNLHLGFTLGLASLALFALVDLCAPRGPALMRQLAARLVVWAGFAMIAVAATGLNPYGWRLYGYIWELSHKSAMNAHIRELMPPDPSQPAIQLAIGQVVLARRAAHPDARALAAFVFLGGYYEVDRALQLVSTPLGPALAISRRRYLTLHAHHFLGPLLIPVLAMLAVEDLAKSSRREFGRVTRPDSCTCPCWHW